MNLSISTVDGIPEVCAGDRLGALLLATQPDLRDGDVVVVASKAVAKAEGRVVKLEPGIDAWRALVEKESVRVLRRRGALLITETAHGFVCANAGIDRSNVAPGFAVLLPKDPDNSAHVLRNEIRGLANISVGVIVSDTAGRAWRSGVADYALGCAGMRPIVDLRGTKDSFGNDLDITQICVVDQIAAGAAMVVQKAAQTPMAIVRGLDNSVFGEGSIRKHVIRPYDEDLFR